MKSLLKKTILSVYAKLIALFKAQPKKITANIVQLAVNDLLKGKIAIITGGTSGIGFSIADAMLRANADAVIITGRTEKRCREAVEKLIDMTVDRNNRVFYEVMDIRETKSFEQHFSNMQNKIVNRNIDILCNNAGVQGAIFGSADEENYDYVMDTNYKGAFFLSQIFAHYLIDHKIEGNILNIASSSSLRPTNSAYSLSKACMKEFTAGLAKYLIQYGIVVNGVAPGPTATPLMKKNSDSSIEHPSNPTGRYALPEEVANMVVVLTSDLGRMVVGSIVYMTGGSGNITFDDCKYNF